MYNFVKGRPSGFEHRRDDFSIGALREMDPVQVLDKVDVELHGAQRDRVYELLARKGGYEMRRAIQERTRLACVA